MEANTFVQIGDGTSCWNAVVVRARRIFPSDYLDIKEDPANKGKAVLVFLPGSLDEEFCREFLVEPMDSSGWGTRLDSKIESLELLTEGERKYYRIVNSSIAVYRIVLKPLQRRQEKRGPYAKENSRATSGDKK